MLLTVEDKVEFVLLRGEGRLSYRAVSTQFQQRHPDRPKPSPQTIKNICELFKATGSVHPIKWNRRTTHRRVQEIDVVAAFHAHPTTSIRQLAANSDRSKSTIQRIVKKNGLKPYKPSTQHKLFLRDCGPRIQFSMSILQQLGEDPEFIRNIMITDECIFYTNGLTCHQNSRMWATENPYWIREDNSQYRQSVLVWCGIFNRKIYGPYIFDGNVTGVVYLEMLKNYLGDILHDMSLVERRNLWFQQDGAPAHYANIVTRWLNETFPNRWIGRNGAVAWPPRSPDLSACDFFLWGHIKQTVFQTPVDNKADLTQRIIEACRTVYKNSRYSRLAAASIARLSQSSRCDWTQHYIQLIFIWPIFISNCNPQSLVHRRVHSAHMKSCEISNCNAKSLILHEREPRRV
ncbi:uncharacterized protein LOC143369387 [Andrena cerasifolii]|uniref:uncharacterized protein LOC143369387 n=1 Tax=Andrena cerasifolii TaxID=2819439 RepID=UPI00403824EC